MAKRMRLYVSGPITGIPNARANFDLATRRLCALGYEAINPFTVIPTADQCNGSCILMVEVTNPHDAEAVKNGGHSYECIIRHDIEALHTCDGMAMLPDWDTSRGAKLELQAAMDSFHLVIVKSLDWWCGRPPGVVQSMYQAFQIGATT